MHTLHAPSVWKGHRVRVVFELANGRRHTSKLTRIDLETEIDATLHMDDAQWFGAPRQLVAALVRGDVAPRLDTIRSHGFGVHRLSVGLDAKRDGCRSNGVHLALEGWPEDEAALEVLLDTVVAVADAARRERSGRAMLGVSGPHPEVIAYELAYARARRSGFVLAASVLATCVALTVFVIAATAMMAPV